MSTTDIYFLREGDYDSASIRNAWRGAMYIWNDVARRYCGFEHFPMGLSPAGKEKMALVWNFHNRRPGVMAEHEAIVLLSTMDNLLLEPDQWERLVSAFEKYGEEHPNSSFSEQAAAIREVMTGEKADGVVAIGWNQTSIGDSRWVSCVEDEEVIYDPAHSDEHVWLMQDFDKDMAIAAAGEASCE